MSYEVIVERKARKAMVRLPQAVCDRVMRAIEGLAEDPRPRQAVNRSEILTVASASETTDED